MKNIVIIGNGIAGITAARHIRKLSEAKITVISGESAFFFSRTALMYIYMGHMSFENTKPYEDSFWKKNNIQLVKAWVTAIQPAEKRIILNKNNLEEELSYDTLVIATGATPNKFGWPGQDLTGVQGLYSLQDLEEMEKNTKNIQHAVIVGGGLIGIEMAEMLHSKNIPVTYLVREHSFWAGVLPKEESQIINQEIISHHINLKLGTELKSLQGGENGRVTAVTTSTGEIIECQFVGLTVGVRPNIKLVEKTGIATDRGILVDEYLQTSVPEIYAIGDCAQLRSPLPHRQALEQVWYTGRMMGETIAQTITGSPTQYKPGIWFNSAKFFNIEYQTYGKVPNLTPDDEESFLWKNEHEKKLLRVNYKKADYTITGVNALGMRIRHDVWNQWISQKLALKDVISNLKAANFDPEFYKKHEMEIQQQYNQQFPADPVAVGEKGWLKKLIRL